MLPPEYLEQLADDLMELYGALDEAIVRDIARRLAKAGGVTWTAGWQLRCAQEAGLLYEDIVTEVTKITDASEAQIQALFEDAGAEALRWDTAIYEAAGLSPPPLRQSPAALQRLTAGLKKTNGQLRNLTLTTASQAQQAYIQAATLAEMKIESGAFSYQQAVRDAISQAAANGAWVQYPSGHRDRLDVAVRRAVLTGVNQTAAEISLGYADDMGCDLVETTAHPGARPEHMIWQGKIFSHSGHSSKYPAFISSTGYGTGSGLCGYNCRHSFFPYFEGLSERAYPRERLREYEEKSVSYQGEKVSYYDATQKQRGMEREIRASKRELAALDEAAKATDDPVLQAQLENDFAVASVTLKRREAALKDFLGQTGLQRDSARVQVMGFGRSPAARAVAEHKRIARLANSMYDISTEEANINAYLRDLPLRKKIQSAQTVTTIEPGQFRKHVPGTLEYNQYVAKLERLGQFGPSRLSITQDEAQALIEHYKGTGILERRKGIWRGTEIITVHPEEIGVVVDNRSGKEAATTVFKIHYGPRGTHIVPDYPSKKGAKGRE